MGRTRSALIITGALLCAVAAHAQQPGMAGPPPQGQPPQQRERGPRPPMRGEDGMDAGPGMRRAGPPDALASHLLAHVGQLKLTDQQVTKLAAIARRADERHRAMRTSMDSMARLAAPLAAGSAPRESDAMRAAMERAREMEHGDIRDALGILTADQQADAWIMRGAAGRPQSGHPGRGGRR